MYFFYLYNRTHLLTAKAAIFSIFALQKQDGRLPENTFQAVLPFYGYFVAPSGCLCLFSALQSLLLCQNQLANAFLCQRNQLD